MSDSQKSLISWIGERVAAGLTIMAGLSMAFGFIWMVARNEIVAGVQSLSGIVELTSLMTTRLDGITARLDAMGDRLDETAERVEEAHPDQVTVYDPFRSRILSPCEVGGECKMVLRIMRTSFGEECSAPEVLSRIVEDISGNAHSAEPGKNARPSRISDEWSIRYPSFFVPEFAEIGYAQFYMVLKYDCPGQTVIETSPRFDFEIVETH